jgi:hypothetical protein
MSGSIDELFFSAIKKQAYAKQLMSRDHFSVDGTLLKVSASMKSFKPKESADDHDDDGEISIVKAQQQDSRFHYGC